MRKRLSDQVLILQAVGQVRAELKQAYARGENFIVIGEVMLRLATLYSLLNVEQLTQAVEAVDTRNERKAA